MLFKHHISIFPILWFFAPTPSAPFSESFWHGHKVSKFRNSFMYPDIGTILVQKIFTAPH